MRPFRLRYTHDPTRYFMRWERFAAQLAATQGKHPDLPHIEADAERDVFLLAGITQRKHLTPRAHILRVVYGHGQRFGSAHPLYPCGSPVEAYNIEQVTARGITKPQATDAIEGTVFTRNGGLVLGSPTVNLIAIARAHPFAAYHITTPTLERVERTQIKVLKPQALETKLCELYFQYR